MRYITETRNLFDINSVKKVSGNPSFSRNGNQITVSYGFPAMYQSANFLLDTSLVGKVVTITALAMTSGLNNTCIRIQWVANSGLAGGQEFQSNIITGNSFQKLTLRAVVPESPGGNFNNLCIMFYSNYNASLEDGVTYSSTFKDVMIELGDTATPYVPYGCLPMRRMKYKLNNVCQLLDKSKYYPTQTNSGITFTNNGDGTITVNGTATGQAEYGLTNPLIHCKDNHKYLVKGSPSGGGYNLYRITTSVHEDGSYVTGFSDSGSGNISNALLGSYTISVFIDIYKGQTVSNLVFKPQIFDLTEMYGAGHEPTSVEQFRQDFPEEMYDYSPYCWSSMKNIRYLDTTKNLFDIPLTQGYPSNTNFDNSTKRTFTIGTYIVGLSRNNYYSEGYIKTVNVSKNRISFKLLGGWFGVSVPCLLTVGKTYTFSCKTDNNHGTNIGISYYKENGELISFTDVLGNTNNIVKSFTVPENTYYTLILFTGAYSEEYTYYDIQIEEGNTATDYVPYGYLPLK